MSIRALFVASLALTTSAAFADHPITVTILHTNDLHAHIEQTMIRQAPYGSYARHATIFKKVRAEEKNVLLLNAGDTCQGTLYYNIHEGIADISIMNALGYSAGTLGNHEFDRGPRTLARFLKAAKFPIVSANIDASQDPDLKGLIKPSTIVEVGGEKFGIVGATTPDTPNISSPGPTLKFDELRSTVQASIDDLRKGGIKKIILLTHIGYEEDMKLATQLQGLSVIVGGHSHTPLGTPDLPGWRKSNGPYPTRIKNAEGKDVLIVQAWEWGKVVGKIKLDFDAEGNVSKVVEATPIVVDKSIPEDSEIAAMITEYQKPVLAVGNVEIGFAPNGVSRETKSGESLMGNMVADAMLAALKPAKAVVAFINQGGIRAALEAGKITYGMAVTVQPFSNSLVTVELTGAELSAILEQGVESPNGAGGLLHPSAGTKYKYDATKPAGSRISDLQVAGSPVDVGAKYVCGFLSFTASGGDSHFLLKDSKGKRVDTGYTDIDALVEFIKKNSPLTPKFEGRLEIGK